MNKSFELKTHKGSSPSSGISELKYSLHFSLFCKKCKKNRAFIAHKLYSSRCAFQLICFNCRSGYQVWLAEDSIQRVEKFNG